MLVRLDILLGFEGLSNGGFEELGSCAKAIPTENINKKEINTMTVRNPWLNIYFLIIGVIFNILYF
jgi:hypothetical protein